MKIKIFTSIIAAFSLSLAASGSSECPGCWTPKLSFDIENRGFLSSMSFIAGHSYALTMMGKKLKAADVKIYCPTDGVGSKELIFLLNQHLNGTVTAQQVTDVINQNLEQLYPCEG